MILQERDTNEKNEEIILKTKTDEADERILRKGTGQNQEHPRESVTPEKKIRALSYRGRKEQTGSEREKVVAEGKRQSLYEEVDDSRNIKHGDRSNRKEQENVPQTLRSTSGEEEDEKPFYYKSFRPPYTKSRMSNGDSSLSGTSTGKDIEEVPDQTKTPGHIGREDGVRQDDSPNAKVKPVAKSVRRRFLKPQAGTEQEGEKQQQRKDLDHKPKDEEESKLDWLLSYYSKKKSEFIGSKPEPVVIKPAPQQAAPAADNTTTGRDMKEKGKDCPPPRTSSLPNESTSVELETPKKGHARAASFQAENMHVHPKLPDYDDFLARLASLRGVKQ